MKLNIVMDASGMFYRSLFTVGNFDGKKGEKLLDTKKSQGVFMRKLATDFSSIIREIENPSRVIVCMDSSSWRKTIQIDDGGYKHDREEKKEDSPVNWKVFYELIEKFSVILSQKGYIVSKIPGAEADDLLYLWSRMLNDMGENVILVTGDRDLLQTVQLSPNGAWTISLDPVNKRKKISLTQETYESRGRTMDTVPDIFNPDSWSSAEDVLEKLLSSYELNIVNVHRHAVAKVILGDGGDAVPGIITWADKKDPSKMRSMTENNYNKLLEAVSGLSSCTWKDLQKGKFVEEISSFISNLRKVEVDTERVRLNMKRNCTLVVLSDEIIPIQIQEAFKKSHETVPLMVPHTGAESILGGSEWWSNDRTAFVPKSYDLFGDL